MKSEVITGDKLCEGSYKTNRKNIICHFPGGLFPTQTYGGHADVQSWEKTTAHATGGVWWWWSIVAAAAF